MTETIAILSDLCGNKEATEAVLEDIKTHGINRTVCLGGYVGYGADPLICLQHAKHYFDICLLGDIECAILMNDQSGFQDSAHKPMLKWTRKKLRPENDWLEWLSKLPRKYIGQGWESLQGNPLNASPKRLVRHNLIFDKTFIQEYLSSKPGIAFVGGDHESWIWKEPAGLMQARDLANVCELSINDNAIVSVGSVGQPRDSDSRACYVIFDGEKIVWRRVEYDIQSARDKIISVPELPNSFGERLSLGV